MRIAFHVPRASHLKPGLSGDRVLVQNLLAGLLAQGHYVEVVSRLSVRDLWRGRVPARRFVREALSIRDRMRRFSPDAWFIYNASVTNPDLFGWWLRPRRYVHFATEVGRGKRLPRRWRWLLSAVHRRSLRRADRLATNNGKHARNVRALGIPGERVCLLGPAPAPVVWHHMPSRKEARERLGLPQEAAVMLCVTRLPAATRPRPTKLSVVLDLLAAMAPLPPDLILLLVGDDGPGRPLVEDEIDRLGVFDRVRFVGNEERIHLVGSLGNEGTRWFYAASDFYAYPHPLDLFFLSPLEAQASGRPVVMMDNESTRVAVDAGRTGLLAKDLDQFRDHIAALARDRGRCEVMGRAAREYIERHHSIETRVSQIEELLTSTDFEE